MAAPTAEQEELVRRAARALASAGLVHAYGHCSLRLGPDSFLVCAALPMGVITDQRGAIVPLDGPLPEGVLGEVRVHREIYRRRPDAGGICRVMPPTTMALSSVGLTPRPRHGLGAYLAPQPRFWDDPRLLRDDEAAVRLAETLGEARAIVMRGNGAITVGESLPAAAAFAFFLEDMARVERDILKMGFAGDQGVLDAQETLARQTLAGGVIERMWLWLTRAEDG